MTALNPAPRLQQSDLAPPPLSAATVVAPFPQQWDELPPSAHPVQGNSQAAKSSKSPTPTAFPNVRWWAIAAAAFVGLAWFLSGQSESGHSDWSHHEQAARHWKDTQTKPVFQQQSVKWVSPMGPALFVGGFAVSAADAEHAGSRSYLLHLYDSCAEDGDAVEVLIGQRSLGVFPLNNLGTNLTVPVYGNNPTPLTIKGVKDGGGGITVACRTSLGQGFVRTLEPGEEQLVFVNVQ